jgi:nucleoid DNA-binding protein
MTLTKDHIINSISNHLDLPKRTSAVLFQSMLETIKKTHPFFSQINLSLDLEEINNGMSKMPV